MQYRVHYLEDTLVITTMLPRFTGDVSVLVYHQSNGVPAGIRTQDHRLKVGCFRPTKLRAHYQKLNFQRAYSFRALVVLKRVELFLDPYERPVRTARQHHIWKAIQDSNPYLKDLQSCTLTVLLIARNRNPSESFDWRGVKPVMYGSHTRG